MSVTATAPGRVNLIGEHTDYMGGLVLPMAVDLATTIQGEPGGASLVLRSDWAGGTAEIPLPVTDPSRQQPPWARFPAAVAAELALTEGFCGTVTSTLPVGGGLSSSSALTVAAALALGAPSEPLELAELARRAETAASGVPCGIMDQLCSAAGIEGHALLIDCSTLQFRPVALPPQVGIWVLDSGQSRELAGSAYAERRAECEAAAQLIGALPDADLAAVEAIEDPLLRARARHVRTECDRVEAFAAAVTAGDLGRAGELMVGSHMSLRDDFAVSTPVLDDLVEELLGIAGVHGARLTGAGFGGCVVALADPDVDLSGAGHRSWRVRPSAGARVERSDS